MTSVEEVKVDNHSNVKMMAEVQHKIDSLSEEPMKPTFWSSLTQQSFLDLLAIFLAEMIGTALLVFIGCMGAVDGFHFKPTHLTISLSFGLAVMIIINIFACISGGHFNPVITLTAVIYKNVGIPKYFFYFLAQMLGGYLGYGLLRVVTPSEFFKDDKFCMSIAAVEPLNAFVIEFIITIILTLVYCAIIDPRNSKHHDSVPLRFGLTVTCIALVAGSYTGSSMNPARSFGPALYNWNWENHWVYWAGPYAGALFTALTFRFIFYRKPKPITH